MTSARRLQTPVYSTTSKDKVGKASLDFSSNFKIGQQIGLGSESIVYECRNLSTSEKCAVKVSDITRIDTRMLEAECNILTLLNHDNIIKSYGLYYVRDKVHLVTELVEGEELHEVIRQSGGIAEEDAVVFVHQLLVAVQYLHKNSICHRDIKPENILISTDGTLKLIDFGLAVDLAGTDGSMKACVGTQAYQAPEVLIGATYNISVDMWAIGATTFTLLSGTKPFGYGPHGDSVGEFGPSNEQRSHQRAKILNGDYNFSDPIWESISSDAKDFVSKLLKVRPNERIDPTAALEHSWIASKEIDLRSFHFKWRSKCRERKEAARKEKRELMFAMKSERPTLGSIEVEEEGERPTLSARKARSQSVMTARNFVEPKSPTRSIERKMITESDHRPSTTRGDRPYERSAERTLDRSSERSSDRYTDRSTDRSTDRYTDRSDRTTERSYQRSTDRATHRQTETISVDRYSSSSSTRAYTPNRSTASRATNISSSRSPGARITDSTSGSTRRYK
eukprot:TRINITY_DN3593_c0_g1_i1.p1 TRINITY_DN3593_c0_g1~~TRINITY_DN3593_c0_g1_i1.p1  ORF type:complete len:509 (-),score=46.94 TRINITY_DN3593_c0_g1_i1:70-1596(-)